MSEIVNVFGDSAVVAKRNLIKIKRVPEVLVFVLLSPIMFVLLFAYVFGGAIDVPGTSYREFLIAGIFAQTVMFGATFTGTGIAEDMQKGIINRFRSLPMARSAVLAGRTASDVIYNLLSIAIMAITKYQKFMLVFLSIRLPASPAAASTNQIMPATFSVTVLVAGTEWDSTV